MIVTPPPPCERQAGNCPPRVSGRTLKLGVGETFAQLQRDLEGGRKSPAQAVPWNTDIPLPRAWPGLVGKPHF